MGGVLRTKDGHSLTAFRDDSGNLKWAVNCHGYTFADGKYCIDDRVIENYLTKTSLLENTATPKVGDVAIYRVNGSVVHSARVTSVDKAGLVKVTMASGVHVYNGSKTTTVNVDLGWTEKGTKIEYWSRTQTK